MSMEERLDPGHGDRKTELSGRARLATFAGLFVASLGALSFLVAPIAMLLGMGGAMEGSGPRAFEGALVGFGASGLLGMGGIFMMFGGGVVAMFASMVWLWARSGDVTRYAAAEQLPVQADVAREMAHVQADVIRTVAPAVGDAARHVARGARAGWREGEEPSNE